MSQPPEVEGGEPARCPSCGADAPATFCSACGARVDPPPLALRPFLREALAELLSLERRLLRTVAPLLLRPGFLTREHIVGRGARYVSPIRLYFAGALLFFGFLTWMGSDVMLLGFLRIVPGGAGDTTLDWVGRVVLVGIPVFAGLLRLLHVRSPRLYVEHLIFALHYQTFLFAIGTPVSLLASALGPDSAAAGWPNLVMQLAVTAYLVVGLWKLNEQRLPWAVLKGALALFLYTAGVIGLALLT